MGTLPMGLLAPSKASQEYITLADQSFQKTFFPEATVTTFEVNMKVKIVVVVKTILQFPLFITFMIMFGLPSLKKYQRKETILVESETGDTGGIEAPAVTIQATNNTLGWKSVQSSEDFDSFELFQHCNRINLTVEECVKSDSVKLTDFLTSVELLNVRNSSASILFDSSPFWKEDMTVTAMGKYFTFKFSQPVSLDMSYCLSFFLARDFDFQVFVHDEDFFVYNANPHGPPVNFKTFEGPSEKNHYQELTLTKHKKLNLDRRPCEEDPAYSFTKCTKESLAKQVATWIRFPGLRLKTGGLQASLGEYKSAGGRYLHHQGAIQVHILEM